MRLRIAGLLAIAGLVLACGQVATLTEATPVELLQKANANLKSAKTTHLEGTGSIALKGGMTMSFDMKLSGDAEVPGKARMTAQMSIFGQNVSADSISVNGHTYVKTAGMAGWTEGASSDPTQGMLDPMGQADLTAATNVTEVDRPTVDGKKTRHLSYSVDPKMLVDKMLQGMQTAASGAAFKPTNASASGEVWIRTDDNQIVRQLVKMAFDIEGDLGLSAGQPTSSTAKASLEVSLDLAFSHIGEAISPAITAPPTVAPVPVRTPAPTR
jgi:hypothetical protein